MAKCICVIQNGERFAHGHCLAFHDRPAVGHVTDPQTLTVQRGSIFDACPDVAPEEVAACMSDDLETPIDPKGY